MAKAGFWFSQRKKIINNPRDNLSAPSPSLLTSIFPDDISYKQEFDKKKGDNSLI
jgi:hypothetical protein